MNLTTKPIRLLEQTGIVRPEFIRLPKTGESDPWTGLARSFLCTLVLPCRENDFRPPVRSCTLRRRGTAKGVRLIDFQSLIDYINAKVEPTYRRQGISEAKASELFADTSVRTIGLEEPFRIIISLRVENGAERVR